MMFRKLLISLFLATVALSVGAQKSGNYRNLLADPSVTIDGGKLPIVFINVQGKTIQKDSRILAYMKIINNEDSINYSDTIAHPNQTVDYEGWVGIKYRGNSSFTSSDKKPYAIQTLATNVLTEDGGEKQKTKILGMAKDSKWAMIAPWCDRSMIRDALAFELGRPWFDFVPHTRFCEVILDGTYYGVYVFTERVSKGNKRLDLNDPGEDGGDLTGDYQVEIDRSDSPYYTSSYHPWSSLSGGEETNKTIKYQYVNPESDEFSEFPGAKAALQNEIDQMEKSFVSSTWNDEQTGYRKYIDVNSFIDYMLSTELAKNIDGYRLSTNLYKYSKTRALAEGLDSRWKMSLWDFNIAYGNANYYSGDVATGWQYEFNTRERSDSEHVPFYWYKMLSDETFVADMKARWQAYRDGNYSDKNLFALVDSLSNRLVESGAVDRNTQAWQIFDKGYIWPCPDYPANYEKEMENLKGWLTERLAWMDKELLGVEPEPEETPSTKTVTYDVTGFTEDIIAENSPVADYTTASVDNSNVFYTSDVNSTGGITSQDIVANGTGVKFRLSDFDSSNALLIDSSNSGTLTLSQPAKTNNLYILGTSTNGVSTMNVRINYADGTSSDETAISFNDWSVHNPTGEEAVSGLGRCTRNGNNFGSDPHYCMFDTQVEADVNREIESVTFSHVSGVRAFITALSGDLITHDAVLVEDRATAGTSGAESYHYLFDDDTSTKWGFNWSDTEVSVVFHATYPVAVESYTVTTANDNETNMGRNPKSWQLYGSNDTRCPATTATSWELIHEVSDSQMQDVNFTPYTYDVSSATPYRYFKWTITGRMGTTQGWGMWDRYVQMSEFDIATATVDNTSDIPSVTTDQGRSSSSDAIYNVQGQRVDGSYEGIVIKNGKKYLRK